MTRWSLLELELLSRVYPYATDHCIGSALGRSASAVMCQRQLHGWSKPPGLGHAAMSAEAVTEAWRRVQAGQPLTPALLAWPHRSTPTGTVGRHSRTPMNRGRGWLRGDLELLESLLGCCPVAEMARLLGRSRAGVVWALQQQGWMNRHLQFGARGLAHALAGEGKYVSFNTVRTWMRRDLVRVVREGGRGRLMLVHRDDAEWLLSNYQYGAGFPRHPGALEDSDV